MFWYDLCNVRAPVPLLIKKAYLESLQINSFYNFYLHGLKKCVYLCANINH